MGPIFHRVSHLNELLHSRKRSVLGRGKDSTTGMVLSVVSIENLLEENIEPAINLRQSAEIL